MQVEVPTSSQITDGDTLGCGCVQSNVKLKAHALTGIGMINYDLSLSRFNPAQHPGKNTPKSHLVDFGSDLPMRRHYNLNWRPNIMIDFSGSNSKFYSTSSRIQDVQTTVRFARGSYVVELNSVWR